jgi:RimJ/RimL family protein N-acetyltransferase
VSKTIVFNPTRVLAFINERQPLAYVAGMKGIGLEEDGQLIAGVAYEGFNGSNVWMHVAAVPGARWMTREYLQVCFAYPFNQLGVRRVSGYVEATNTAARRFDEHLGFKQEAILKGAGKNDGDVLIYCMRREDCRYVQQN